MGDFKLAFFCFSLLLICYFITTFSLINAVPFRHCALFFFRFLCYFSKFDFGSARSLVCWLTFQFIYLSNDLFRTRETLQLCVLEKRFLVCDRDLSKARSRPWLASMAAPFFLGKSWQCLGGGERTKRGQLSLEISLNRVVEGDTNLHTKEIWRRT